MNYINPVIQPDVLHLPEWIVRRLLPMECGRLQGFPDGWGEIAPLTDETEIPFWREVYLRNCKIKGQKPKKIIARADGARSDAAVKKWHDELHSLSVTAWHCRTPFSSSKMLSENRENRHRK